MDKQKLSYKDAGVDIDAGNALVDNIKSVVKKTTRPEVMGGLGGFGALCRIQLITKSQFSFLAPMA